MTDQERQLLLKDLAARVPYGVMVDQSLYNQPIASNVQRLKNVQSNNCVQLYWKYFNDFIPIDCIRPYLRPMSSMTDDEKFEYDEMSYFYDIGLNFNISEIDWLNSHYFDYRGLIKKGLALEAPEGMYKTK